MEVPLDVLQHHDRIVDQDADDQRHREQRNRVEREVRQAHRGQGDEERGRDRDHHHDRVAPGAQEEQHHDTGEDHRFDQRAHHAGQLLLRIGRLHVEDRELHVGIGAAQAGQRGQHVLRGLDLTRVGRLLDIQLDRRDAVGIREHPLRLVGIADIGHVADAEQPRRRAPDVGAGRRVGTRAEQEVRNGSGVLDVAAHIEVGLAVGTVEDAARRADVVVRQRAHDVGQREARRAQLLRIDRNLNRRRDRAVLLHERDALELLERRHDLVHDERGEVTHAQRLRAQDERHDDRFARVVDRDLRRLHVVGQRVLAVLHAPLDLHQVVVLIRAQLEHRDDRGLAGLNRGLEMVQIGRAGELIFERPHDRIAHLGGRRARIADQHLDRRRRRIRELLLDERQAADRAGQQHEGKKDRDERRPFDE